MAPTPYRREQSRVLMAKLRRKLARRGLVQATLWLPRESVKKAKAIVAEANRKNHPFGGRMTLAALYASLIEQGLRRRRRSCERRQP